MANNRTSGDDKRSRLAVERRKQEKPKKVDHSSRRDWLVNRIKEEEKSSIDRSRRTIKSWIVNISVEVLDTISIGTRHSTSGDESINLPIM